MHLCMIYCDVRHISSMFFKRQQLSRNCIVAQYTVYFLLEKESKGLVATYYIWS